MPREPKQKLSDILLPKIQEGFGTQKAFATHARLGYELLRKALSKNLYAPADLERILSALNVKTAIAQLHKEYEFHDHVRPRGIRRVVGELDQKRRSGTARLRDAFSLFEEQAKRLQSQFRGLNQDVERAFSAMTAGDVMVLVLSDDYPLEWTGEDAPRLTGEVMKLLERGASICYLYPSSAAFQRLQESRASDNLKDPKQFEMLFKAFQRQLKRLDRRNLVDGRVAAVPCDMAAYFAAGHKFCLYFHCDEDPHFNGSWAVAAVPIAIGREGGRDVGSRAFLPLSHGATDQFYSFCLQAIGSIAEPDAYGRAGILDKTDEKLLADEQSAALLRVLRLLEGSRIK